MTNFSKNLKYLRKERNLSQQELANRIGIKQRTYSDYESGRSEPTIGIAQKIADFFNIRLDILVGFGFNEEHDIPLVELTNEEYDPRNCAYEDCRGFNFTDW